MRKAALTNETSTDAELQPDAISEIDDAVIEPDDSATEPDESTDEVLDPAPDLEEEADTKPAVKGPRLSLRERLAARRLEEQGDQNDDEEGKWFVLHTYSGYENKVKKTIETRVESLDLVDRVHEIVVPTQEEIEIKNGDRKSVV